MPLSAVSSSIERHVPKTSAEDILSVPVGVPLATLVEIKFLLIRYLGLDCCDCN